MKVSRNLLLYVRFLFKMEAKEIGKKLSQFPFEKEEKVKLYLNVVFPSSAMIIIIIFECSLPFFCHDHHNNI